MHCKATLLPKKVCILVYLAVFITLVIRNLVVLYGIIFKSQVWQNATKANFSLSLLNASSSSPPPPPPPHPVQVIVLMSFS